jgi:hypothetical protein
MLVEGSKDIIPKPAPFSGQRIVILECQESRFDPDEISAAADSLAFQLDNSDWLNAWGEHILLPYPANAAKNRTYNRIVFDSPDHERCSQGIFIEIKPNASQKVRDAAKALADALVRSHLAAIDLGRLN